MNQTELQSALGDVYYEVRMLFHAYSNYWEHEQSRHTKLPEWIHNCVVEATMVHARALLDFFERARPTSGRAKERCADDVFAEDYGFTPALFPLSTELRKRINTSIAHLSLGRTRLTDSERHWQFTVFIPQIMARSAEFFQFLVDSNRKFPSHLTPKKIATLIADAQSRNS